MSWTDYTHAKHFGNGVFRPYSDFMGDVLLQLDTLLADDPAFARASTPFATRDTILIIGGSTSLFAISRSSHRHYPFFSTYKWSEFWTVAEPVFIAQHRPPSTAAQRMVLPELLVHLTKSFSFVDPIVFSVPSVFQPMPSTPEAETRDQSVASAAKLIWTVERQHYEEALELERPKEIFLSHKSADKKLVREVAQTLNSIGFVPWLDDNKMKAGANLERSIRDGFSSSCAAVFFVTPNFIDEGYLATEIDYALAEKRAKGERFAIITLLLRGQDGMIGTVPQMISQYVWKAVEPVEIVRTIVEALPIRMERIAWRQ